MIDRLTPVRSSGWLKANRGAGATAPLPTAIGRVINASLRDICVLTLTRCQTLHWW